MDRSCTNFSSFCPPPPLPPPDGGLTIMHKLQIQDSFQYINKHYAILLSILLCEQRNVTSIRFTKAPMKQSNRVFTMPQRNDKRHASTPIHTKVARVKTTKNRVSACTLGQTSSWQRVHQSTPKALYLLHSLSSVYDCCEAFVPGSPLEARSGK